MINNWWWFGVVNEFCECNDFRSNDEGMHINDERSVVVVVVCGGIFFTFFRKQIWRDFPFWVHGFQRIRIRGWRSWSYTVLTLCVNLQWFISWWYYLGSASFSLMKYIDNLGVESDFCVLRSSPMHCCIVAPLPPSTTSSSRGSLVLDPPDPVGLNSRNGPTLPQPKMAPSLEHQSKIYPIRNNLAVPSFRVGLPIIHVYSLNALPPSALPSFWKSQVHRR